MALTGAIAPLGKVAGQKKHWLAEVAIYTLAGGVASALVGSILGLFGKLILPMLDGRIALCFVLALGCIAFGREIGWLSTPLPQLKRQTKDVWSRIFPRKLAALLWGLDLGLIFSTRLTFSGIWILASIVILIGIPSVGAALLLCYWLGRAFSLWVAPFLLPSAISTDWALEQIFHQYELFRRTHTIGICLLVLFLLLSLLHYIAK